MLLRSSRERQRIKLWTPAEKLFLLKLCIQVCTQNPPCFHFHTHTLMQNTLRCSRNRTKTIEARLLPLSIAVSFWMCTFWNEVSQARVPHAPSGPPLTFCQPARCQGRGGAATNCWPIIFYVCMYCKTVCACMTAVLRAKGKGYVHLHLHANKCISWLWWSSCNNSCFCSDWFLATKNAC